MVCSSARWSHRWSEHYLTKPFTKMNYSVQLKRSRKVTENPRMALILLSTTRPLKSSYAEGLEKHGFKPPPPRTRGRGAQGEGHEADLIFMDIVMPGVNGYQATRMLSTTPRPVSSHIMVTTNSGNASLGAAARRGGLLGQNQCRLRRWSRRHRPRWPHDRHDVRHGAEFAQPARPSVRIAQGIGKAQPDGGRGNSRMRRAARSGWSGVRMAGNLSRRSEETREVLGYPAVVSVFPAPALGEGMAMFADSFSHAGSAAVFGPEPRRWAAIRASW